MLLVSAGALFERVGEQTRQGLGRITEPAILSVRLLSRTRLVTAKTEAARLDAAPLLIETLESGRQLSAAYVGYDDGDFIAIRPIDPDSTFGRALLAAVRVAISSRASRMMKRASDRGAICSSTRICGCCLTGDVGLLLRSAEAQLVPGGEAEQKRRHECALRILHHTAGRGHFSEQSADGACRHRLSM